MSLLVFTTNFPPEPGGIARFLDEFCHHLPPPVHVLTTVPEDAAEPVGAGRNWQVTRIDAGENKPRIWRALTAGLMRHRPTVALLGHGHSAACALPMTVWKGGGRRFGIIVYALEVKRIRQARGIKRAVNSIVYRNADFVIAISRFTKQLLVDAGIDERKIHIINPGVGSVFFTAEDRRESVREQIGADDAFVMGTVARLVKRKGHELVLRALAQLPSRDWRYLVIGDGPERSTLEELSADLEIAERVTFMGHTGDEELPGLYDAMDLFVLPTQVTDDPYDVEGFGIVFLEAAARFTPAVGSPIGGVTDAVADGQTGLLVPPTPEDIAGAIDGLMSDDALLERMSRRARQRTEEQFTWEQVAERFATVAGL